MVRHWRICFTKKILNLSENYRKESDGKFYVKYQVIGANHVAVPTHFYKVIVGENPDEKYELESYVMPNKAIENNVPLTSFQVSYKLNLLI